MKINYWLNALIAIAVSLLAGIIGSLFTISSIGNWYIHLQKPEFSPPNWIFAPVWNTLYILMGIAASLVWQKGWKNKEIKKALAVFIFQLLLNAFWSIIFFGLKNPGLALVEIIFMWLAILWTIIYFYKISR